MDYLKEIDWRDQISHCLFIIQCVFIKYLYVEHYWEAQRELSKAKKTLHAHFPPFSVINSETSLEQYTIKCDLYLFIYIHCHVKKIFEFSLKKKKPEIQKYETNRRLN